MSGQSTNANQPQVLQGIVTNCNVFCSQTAAHESGCAALFKGLQVKPLLPELVATIFYSHVVESVTASSTSSSQRAGRAMAGEASTNLSTNVLDSEASTTSEMTNVATAWGNSITVCGARMPATL